MATIKDVAREAQVSTATVSATINSSAYVSPDLRARVLAAVDRLGYAPSVIAPSLIIMQSTLIVRESCAPYHA